MTGKETAWLREQNLSHAKLRIERPYENQLLAVSHKIIQGFCNAFYLNYYWVSKPILSANTSDSLPEAQDQELHFASILGSLKRSSHHETTSSDSKEKIGVQKLTPGPISMVLLHYAIEKKKPPNFKNFQRLFPTCLAHVVFLGLAHFCRGRETIRLIALDADHILGLIWWIVMVVKPPKGTHGVQVGPEIPTYTTYVWVIYIYYGYMNLYNGGKFPFDYDK